MASFLRQRAFQAAVARSAPACAAALRSSSAAASALRLGTARSFSTRPLIAARPLSFSACQQLYRASSASYASVTVNVPNMGDSISEGTLGTWEKNKGDYVNADDLVCIIETDKVANDLFAPEAGVIEDVMAAEGDTVHVGQALYKIDTSAEAPKEEPKAAAPEETKTEAKPATPEAAKPASKSAEAPKTEAKEKPSFATPGKERRVPMSRMRQRIAERLKDSQNTSAMLTTFQECDMHNLMQMRSEFKEEFFKAHGVKLGFMSAFVKASAAALVETPAVNAVIDGDEIVYRDFVDISVAVATPKGLVTPVLRDCDKMTFADVEKEIGALGEKARKGKISLEDLSGGTFTISNGGVYGSLMGTPIINPPQSAILGMHGINKRPVAIGDEVVIRPMMYLALTYDHRLIDGRDAVVFLRKIKDCVEDPRRMLLEL